MRRLFLLNFLILISAAGCGLTPVNPPPAKVSGVAVFKNKRKMYLLNGKKPLKKYDFDLGFSPQGHKRVEGDGKTPEGYYILDHKNPESQYHLSIRISYPNARDKTAAAIMGANPGGDIFIHGTPAARRNAQDWTRGCIAVSNREIEEIYAMVDVGTPIYIYP